ncbi:MAG TPA: hypothetical protein VLC79_03785 [Cellvibrio sp.]|nr:hypothetical protein [Cellvibrio sp.]
MLNHSLIAFALFSFSVVSDAAAVPMDVNQAALVATPNAVLPREGGLGQGGDSDKDVAEALVAVTMVGCRNNTACTDIAAALKAPQVNANPALSFQFAASDESSALQPFIVLLIILAIIVLFLSRESESTK